MALCLVGTSPKTFTYYAVHCHEQYEVILNLEGEGVASIGDTRYPFAPGTIHIIPAGVPHHKESENGFRDIYLQCDTLPPGLLRTIAERDLILLDDTGKTLEQLMKMMLSRYLQVKKNDTVLEGMYQVALELLSEWTAQDSSDHVVDEIICKLTNSFNDPELVVADVLASSGYSRDHIRRRFQSVTGMTPSDYLTDLRIQYAGTLLRQQNSLHLSVTDIGMMSGYYDVRYFSRVFKQKTGVSPSEYAQALKRNNHANLFFI